MTPKLDAGPVIAQDRTPIDSEETAEQLEERLSEIGARLLLQSLDAFQTGQLEEIPQDSTLASKARRMKKTDGLIDWSSSALAIKNHIRAIQPWPKAYTFWHRPAGTPLRLIVGPVSVVDSQRSAVSPGAVLEAESDRLTLQAGEGTLSLTSLQLAGKRMLPMDEFLRGYPVRTGDKFGPESLQFD
jgi:methionyl-tRNA formyltransferase